MYEENCEPLQDGDASVVFAKQLRGIQAELAKDASRTFSALTPQTVVRWAHKTLRPAFVGICRRLLLPGSEIRGLENLRNFVEMAQQQKACLLCLNHRSNLDVPTLYAMLSDIGEASLFDRIVWIAGRKLEEDGGLTTPLVECFNRVIVTPHSWFVESRPDDEVHAARRLNIAAERAIARLRREGWICALFPSGTRQRPGDSSTVKAIEETGSYVKQFQYLLLCHIDGCTLPVSLNHDFTHERPQLERMIYSFGAVTSAEDWLASAVARFPTHPPKLAAALAMTADIEKLSPEPNGLTDSG